MSVSNSISTLNEVSFGSKKSFLLDQSRFSTLNYESLSTLLEKKSKILDLKIQTMIIAQVNISFLRNKFDLLVQMLHSNLDILLISETKIDSSLPTAQSPIGYTTYNLDRNAYGGGILLYIREGIPSILLNTDMSIESFYIEMNIRK